MARGRKPDPPGLQEMKGNPGKRKKRRDAAKMRVAELAAADAINLDPLAPPKILRDPHLETARRIWIELMPVLRSFNLLTKLDRYTFAMYCVHMSDWLSATKDIADNGHSYKAVNVNGDELHRMNPAVKVRQVSERAILEISARFGLDPQSRFKLLREQSLSPLPGDLFSNPQSQSDDQAINTSQDIFDPVGLMGSLSANQTKLN